MLPFFKAIPTRCCFLALVLLSRWPGVQAAQLVSGGVAQAVIVAPDGASDHFVATELQSYIEQSSGGKPEILSVEQVRQYNFHHGHEYVKPVAFDKIFVSWPVLKPVK